MGPVVMCTYRVRADQEAHFMELLARHWTTLHEFELVTDEPSQVLRGVDQDGRPYFVELFTWASDTAAERTHEVPQVLVPCEGGRVTRLRRPGGAPLRCRRRRYNSGIGSSSALRSIHLDPRIRATNPLHRTLSIWEPMEQACEPRDGRPACEFPHLRRVEVLRVKG